MRKFPEKFSDLLNAEHRWPRKGDRLLKPRTDWESSAGFESHQLARDAFIWDGHMTAGAALIDETERRPSDRDLLIYPILFTIYLNSTPFPKYPHAILPFLYLHPHLFTN